MSNLALRDGRGYEKINGVVYAMSSPLAIHQEIASNLMGMFRAYLKGKTCKVYDNLNVKLDEGNTYIPDLFVLCDRSKMKHDGVHGAPELAVEILSTGTAKMDLTVKKANYEKHGVKEYWIIDPKAKSIQVYWNGENGFVLEDIYSHLTDFEKGFIEEKDKEKIKFEFKPSIFDDMVVKLEDVFEDVE